MKIIKHPDESIFLIRLSKKLRLSSLKLHLILNDDIKPHTHPWDFKSLILFGGYNETITGDSPITKTFGFLSLNIKRMNTEHLLKLRRFLGIKIPTITIGIYGEKKQLCSLCKDLGYCKSRKQ